MISSACRSGIASLQFMKRAPSLASAAEDITALMIWETVRMAPLFTGMASSLDMKNVLLLCYLLLILTNRMRRCGRRVPCLRLGMC